MHSFSQPAESPDAAVRAWLEAARHRGWRRTDMESPDPALEEAFEELEVTGQELRTQNEELAALAVELEAERGRYMELFEAAPDGYVVTDAAGVVRQANRAAHMLAGFGPGTLTGKPLAVLITSSQRSEFRAQLNRLARFESITNWECDWVSRSGTRVPLSVNAIPAPANGDELEIRWLLRDVTDQRLVHDARRRLLREQAAREATERLAERMRFLSDAGRSMLDLVGGDQTVQGAVDLAVPQMADMAVLYVRGEHGFSCVSVRHRDETHQAAATGLVGSMLDGDGLDGPSRAVKTGHPEVAPRLEAGELAQAIHSPADRAILQRLGVTAWAALPLRDHGLVRGVLWLLNTNDRALEPDLLPLAVAYADRVVASLRIAAFQDDLIRSRDDAARANEEKARALAMISHDFRTPLAAVVGYTDLLLAGLVQDIPERALEWIGRIRTSSQYQLDLVERILTFTRLENSLEKPVLASIDLVSAIRDAAEQVRDQVVRAGLELRVETPPEPVITRTDPARLRQILTNLLTNAIRFTREGKVGISLRCSEAEALIEVSDTGIGIPPDARERVFDRFWQVKSGPAANSSFGLGLTIVQQLTELLGGRVDLESEVDRGSTFTVRLPLR